MPSGQGLPIKVLEVQGEELNLGMLNIEVSYLHLSPEIFQ